MSPVRVCAPAPSVADDARTRSAAVDMAAAVWAVLSPVVAGGGAPAGRVRVSGDGGRSYPRSRERAWSVVLPGQPAAVRVFGGDGTARCVTADLDVGRGGQGQVDRDAGVLLALVARCGGRAFTDRSPSGGRHVYVPLAVPVGYGELRPVMYALAALLPSLDVAPCVNLLAGCIRPPGARHKSGGWQRLDGPLAAAAHIADRPNGVAVWAALLAELRPQLLAQQVVRADPSLTMPVEAAGAAGPKERRAHAAPPARPGGARQLRPVVLATARTGSYDAGRYRSPSEARQGVLAAAAASGWSFADVLGQLEGGCWPGLWALYARYPDRHRREALAGDWLNALAYATRPRSPGQAAPHTTAGSATATAGCASPSPRLSAAPPGTSGAPVCPGGQLSPSHVHQPDTREPTTHRGGSLRSPAVPAAGMTLRAALGSQVLPGSLPTDGYGLVRAWWTALRLAERDRHTGRQGTSARLVLRALGNAGQKTGRTHLAFGVRSLAIAAGLSRTTVAATLRQLRDADDPLITLLVAGRGLAGDLYVLRIPAAYSEAARTRPWRPGRIEALLPCFRILGTAAAFVYENLDSHPQSSWDLAATALLSTRATQQALAELAAHHLAERERHGWTRGPADPHTVARTLGADTLVAQQVQRYRTERTAWRSRLGAHPGPTIGQLLHTPPGPTEPAATSAGQSWLVTRPRPPPPQDPANNNSVIDGSRHDKPGSAAASSATSPTRDHDGHSELPGGAVALVVRLLGGTVLRTTDT